MGKRGYPFRDLAQPYEDVSPGPLSASEAAGQSPVVAENPDRSGLKIVPQTACFMAILPDQTTGVPLRGGDENAFKGGHCPTNEIYIVGLQAGANVLIWES